MKTQTFGCGHCGQTFACAEEDLGKVVQCPQCNGGVQLPNFSRRAEVKPAKPMAIAALLLALSSFVIGPFGFVPGIVCGHVALRRARKAQSNDGKTMARVGLAIGYVALAVTIVLFGVITAAVRTATSTTHSQMESAPKPPTAAQPSAHATADSAVEKVEVEFGGFAERGPGMSTIMLRIRNGFAKSVTGLEMTYVYLDAQTNQIKEFPMKKTSDELAGPKSTADAASMAPFMPTGTASVRVRLRKVTFGDGTTWTP